MIKDTKKDSAITAGDVTDEGAHRRPSSRRQFAKTMAIVLAAPVLPKLAGVEARSLTTQKTAIGIPIGAVVAGAAEVEGGAQTQQADEITPDAVALAEVVRFRYGKNLSDDQMTEVRRSINNRIRGADRLKQFKLANGDEPAFVFSADPTDLVYLKIAEIQMRKPVSAANKNKEQRQ